MNTKSLLTPSCCVAMFKIIFGNTRCVIDNRYKASVYVRSFATCMKRQLQCKGANISILKIVYRFLIDMSLC